MRGLAVRLLFPGLAIVLGLLALAMAQDGPARRPAPALLTKHFATGAVCAQCHSNRPQAGAWRDPKGRPVAPFDLWQSTMMANAARDPFFLAAVEAEIAAQPERRQEIEAKCLRCHAPMASEEMRKGGHGAPGLDLFLIDTAWSELARDGVSCTLCHQVQPGNLGKPESFSGGFRVGDEKQIYGPHADPLTLPMRRSTGFLPTESAHILKSKHCATCHTLFLGEFPEQTPYLEWKRSSFAPKTTCQTCHVPQADADGARLSSRLATAGASGGDVLDIEPRSPVGRHLLVGGNTLVPALLRDHKELGAVAPPEAFDATIAAVRKQLSERTARLEILDVLDGWEFRVKVTNLCGHKFPTAHPSRRVFLRVRIKSAAGKVLFQSGAFDARGRLLGTDQKPLPFEAAGGPLAPHRDMITRAEQVAVWEAVMKDKAGRPTIRALQAVGYLKDNRLLPSGLKLTDGDILSPVGIGADEDFVGGSDSVIVQVPVPDEVRTYVIEAELYYQTLSPRFAAELFTVDHPRVKTFRRLYESADVKPVLVAKARFAVAR